MPRMHSICECDVIGAPSIFKLTRRAAALAKLLPIFALSCPRKSKRRAEGKCHAKTMKNKKSW